ncbi:S24/S26 family peptidase [Nonomuraea cavernae]|uniref:S24/S26 family peptidase n=1 Tax=Nonomuraea cavernae TaxID=2045107 RepID=UPI001CD94A97|nr:S24/S26 family peptidase [Nonomuraea cavernae]MCA2189918.1 S24/S26 family peptidase [Nonomuraea cavernae]
MTGRRVSMVLAAGVAVAVGLLAVRRRYLVITVNGASMRPAFTDGDRVLVRRATIRLPARGDVVVLRTPPPRAGWNGSPSSRSPARRGWSIKRVAASGTLGLEQHAGRGRSRRPPAGGRRRRLRATGRDARPGRSPRGLRGRARQLRLQDLGFPAC